MPIIDEHLISVVVSALIADPYLNSKIAKDNTNRYFIQPAETVPVGFVFPGITLKWKEGPSESQIPASRDMLTVTVWIDPKKTKEGFEFLKTSSDRILTLFNRQGDAYDQIDVGTDTGIRICQFLKVSREFSHDDELNLDYAELIFEVVKSEDESFDPLVAGDKDWV